MSTELLIVDTSSIRTLVDGARTVEESSALLNNRDSILNCSRKDAKELRKARQCGSVPLASWCPFDKLRAGFV